MSTVISQNPCPTEVIIVDDSTDNLTEEVVNSIRQSAEVRRCRLLRLQGEGIGLTNARNQGVGSSTGEYVLFLDDDTLLSEDLIAILVGFMEQNVHVAGVQPKVLSVPAVKPTKGLGGAIENAVCKVLMLSYNHPDKMCVRRSGASVFAQPLTRAIIAQRLSGCCMCYRREVFSKWRFDTNLRGPAYTEDLCFSYLVYRMKQGPLYVLPKAKVTHMHSDAARPNTKIETARSIVYWCYAFHRYVFEGSLLNLGAFLLSIPGNLIYSMGGLLAKRKRKQDALGLYFLLHSYHLALTNLRAIIRGDLSFI